MSGEPKWEIYEGGNFTLIKEVGKKVGGYLGNSICEISTWDGKEHDPHAKFVRQRAERIVRAVNSHEALVEALEALRAVLKDEASVKVTADFAGQMMFGRAVVLADAALALAKNGREG